MSWSTTPEPPRGRPRTSIGASSLWSPSSSTSPWTPTLLPSSLSGQLGHCLNKAPEGARLTPHAPDPKVFRMRRDGPPVTERRVKGSKEELLAIARSEEALGVATNTFNECTYAPGTTAAKKTRARLWFDFAKALEMDPFPLTPEMVIQFAAALRGAGYRSGYYYLCEAQQLHVRMGFPIDGKLQIAMADAKRGLERGLGPPTRSAEIRPENWDVLHDKVNKGELQLDRPGDAPAGGLYVWGLGCGWLLRELELAMLNVHTETIQVNDATGDVTLKIATSKTDPAGRGAARTLPCRCQGARLPSCAACCARHLLDLAVRAWGGDRASDEARCFPLVGTVLDPGKVVTKASLVRAAQADATLLYSLGVLHVDPRSVTGHFLRRSGAKALARAGVPLAKIQWMGRWGSSAILAYVEEAAEEAPAQLFEDPAQANTSWEALRADVALALSARAPVGGVPGEAKLPEDRLSAVESFLAAVRTEMGSIGDLAKELDALVRPTLVLNTKTRMVHRALRAERLDPESCATPCGWKWALTTRSRPVTAEEVVNAGELWMKCPRCFVDGQ